MAKKKKSRSTQSAKKNDKMSQKKTGSVVYKRNFLTQVLARLDFSMAHDILQGGPPKKVANMLKASFPIIEQKKQFQIQHVQLISAENVKKPKERLKDMQQSKREIFQLFFHSKDRTKNFHFAPDCLPHPFQCAPRLAFRGPGTSRPQGLSGPILRVASRPFPDSNRHLTTHYPICRCSDNRFPL